jgi:hypothetical protein
MIDNELSVAQVTMTWDASPLLGTGRAGVLQRRWWVTVIPAGLNKDASYQRLIQVRVII